MVQGNYERSATPSFSIIIAVYNDWALLSGCLQSLAEQENAPSFEVIVIDDGSTEAAPEPTRRWATHYPLEIIRQTHAGIPAARNQGVQHSRGSILVFVDADSRLKPDCLAALHSAAGNTQHNSFQLQLVGDSTTLLGKAEHLRLRALQNHSLRPDGCIRYVNTAGFAIRRAKIDPQQGLFDPRLLRGEDTLLLANLIRENDLPFFLANAIVQHVVPLSMIGCVRKDFRSAYLERTSLDLIASLGVRIRVRNRDRLKMLWEMWKASASPQIGRLSWVAAVARQCMQRLFSIFWWLCKRRSDVLSP